MRFNEIQWASQVIKIFGSYSVWPDQWRAWRRIRRCTRSTGTGAAFEGLRPFRRGERPRQRPRPGDHTRNTQLPFIQLVISTCVVTTHYTACGFNYTAFGLNYTASECKRRSSKCAIKLNFKKNYLSDHCLAVCDIPRPLRQLERHRQGWYRTPSPWIIAVLPPCQYRRRLHRPDWEDDDENSLYRSASRGCSTQVRNRHQKQWLLSVIGETR